jgi:hypothetical protein
MTMTAPDADRLTHARATRVPGWRWVSTLTPLHWLEVGGLIVVLAAVSPALVRQFTAFGVPTASRLTGFRPLSDSTTAELLGQPVWGPLVGDGEGNLSSSARAIRLGAGIASYELKYQRGDSTAAASASEIARLLDTFRSSGEAATAYRALATDSRQDSFVSIAARLAERVGGKRPVRLGAWLQNARFAAAAEDSKFFEGDVAGAVFRATITMDDRTETEHAARQFEQILRERPYNWAAISTASEELLRLLGTLP